MPPYTLNDEQNQCNEFSPGIVDNDEELLRVLFTPEHIGKDQQVLHTAVSLEDLSDRGLSVHRRKYFDINVVRAQIDRQVLRQPKARQESSVSVLICSAIRGFEDDGGRRCFIVIDEALQENFAHASIYSAFEENSPSQLRKLRIMLLPLMQERRSIDILSCSDPQ